MTQPDGSSPTDDIEAQFFVRRLENWPIYSKFPLSYTFYDLFIFNYVLQPLRLIVRSALDVPNFATMRLHACYHARAPSGRRWNCGREMSGKFCLNFDLHFTFRDLLHAVKLRHGTDNFTSPPKESVLRIFFALKIRRLRPGANRRTWVPNASTPPLDHRSHVIRHNVIHREKRFKINYQTALCHTPHYYNLHRNHYKNHKL